MLEDGLAARIWPPRRAPARYGQRDHELADGVIAALGGATGRAARQYLAHLLHRDGEPGPRARLVTKSAVRPSRKSCSPSSSASCRSPRSCRPRAPSSARAPLHAGGRHRRARRGQGAARRLDFDDLIAKTLALLSRGEAAWVLYKLDRGIDHVLVDEAQDTNPEQWEILRLITEDFTAGTARARSRSDALRGRRSQAVDLQLPGRRAARVRERAGGFWRKRSARSCASRTCASLSRSAPAGGAQRGRRDLPDRAHFRGLSFEDAAIGTVHESARPHAPGLVELWPTGTPPRRRSPTPGRCRSTSRSGTSPPVVVALAVAQARQAWTTTGRREGPGLAPGDILVLVRKRGAAFEAVIRALKTAGVPVAGADRLDIGEHIAVLDLIAAGRAALLPEDDLTLATALKSPLVGLDDDDLIRIAAPAATPSRCSAPQRHAEAATRRPRRGCDALRSWRALARGMGRSASTPPCSGRSAGARKLVARLGSEAGDAIDAFLCFAHRGERPRRLRSRPSSPASSRPRTRSSATSMPRATRCGS